MKYLASFHNTLKVSRYLFRALAILLWVLVAFVSVFYIVNALHDRESEIRQEFNLNADQAQNVIVIKRGKGTGYSGVENALFYTDNCRMLYGDAQPMAGEIIQHLKAMA